MKRLLTAAFAATLLASPAMADGNTHPLPQDGKELAAGLKACAKAGITTDKVADWRACNGYLAGIVVGSTATASALGAKTLFCLPPAIGDGAIANAILAHLENHPELLSAPVPAAVLDALQNAYPCQKAG